MDAHVISLANQKGGTAKTTTCANLGIGLAGRCCLSMQTLREA